MSHENKNLKNENVRSKKISIKTSESCMLELQLYC